MEQMLNVLQHTVDPLDLVRVQYSIRLLLRDLPELMLKRTEQSVKEFVLLNAL
jgi:hypothetical protein